MQNFHFIIGMSRVYIKNLPPNVTEQELRQHFSKGGIITDIQIIERKHIAFIGFRQTKMDEIEKMFNNTYIKNSKIQCYKALDHQNAILKGRKHVEQEKQIEKKGASKLIDQIMQEGGEELQKYLQATNQKSWQNEIITKEDENKQNENNDKQKEDNEEDKQISSTKVKLINLPQNLTEDEINQKFSCFGKITNIAYNPEQNTAFITYSTMSAVEKALQKRELLFQGIFVQIHKAQEKERLPEHVQQFVYFKKAMQKYNNQAKNLTYINANNVNQQLQNQFNINYNETNQNAVLQASGEVILQQELKEAFKKANIDQNNLPDKTKLLITNIPLDVKESDINEMFSQKVTVLQCQMIYPGFCLLSFANTQDAAKAFNTMSFRKVGEQKRPLMIQYAKTIQPQEQEEQKQQQNITSHQLSFYIKNLSFQCKEQDVKNQLLKFINEKDLIYITLRRGYAFFGISYENDDDKQNITEQTIQNVNKIIFQGKKWSCNVSEMRNNQQTGEVETAKLIIKNLPFQTNDEEIKQLLEQFGKIVSLRVPKKIDGRIRGFAFVTFNSLKEAQQAMEKLKQIHFYGRHLIIQQAEDKSLE